MSSIKIYGMNVSTCTMRVIDTLMEKGVENFELVPVDLSKGEHKMSTFLEKQPFGQIPVVEDGDILVYESRAVARYIANKFEGQGTDLLGSTLAEKALVDQWLEVEHSNYNPAISTIVYEKVFKSWFGLSTDESVVKTETEKLEKVLEIYDCHLAKHQYLAGDKFTLADLSHLPYTHYLINIAKHGEVIMAKPNVKAWWERISSRPQWQKVLEYGK